MKYVSGVRWKLARRHDVPDSKLHCWRVFLGWYAMPFDLQTWNVLWHPKSSVLVSSDQTIISQYFTGLSICCSANLKCASMCHFFSKRVLCGERAYRPLYIVLIETTVPSDFLIWAVRDDILFEKVIVYSTYTNDSSGITFNTRSQEILKIEYVSSRLNT